MIPGQTLILQCPECESLLQRETLMSGNTFDAIHYSDYKTEAPHLPSLPIISKCNRCNTIFWLDKLKKIGSYSYGKTNQEDWEAAEIAGFLNIEDLFRALNTKGIVSEKEDELYIRQNIWWAYNDRVRNGNNLFESSEDELKWRNNINHMMALLDPNDENEKMFIAELHRNLGNFEDCQSIMDSIRSSDYDWIKEPIRLECKKRNSLVIELK